MGYGGTQHATVHVDLVTADVEAIVDGICGAGDDTLSDVEGRLSDVDGRLYDGSTSAVEWLQYIQWDTSDADSYLSNIEGYLYEDGYSAAEWLEQIEYDTYEMADDLDSVEGYLAGYDTGALYDGSQTAVSYLSDIYNELDSIEGYLYQDGYSAAEWLYEIETDTSEMADDLDSIEEYLYDWVNYRSVADYLRDIYEILYDVWDDSSGALRTVSA